MAPLERKRGAEKASPSMQILGKGVQEEIERIDLSDPTKKMAKALIDVFLEKEGLIEQEFRQLQGILKDPSPEREQEAKDSLERLLTRMDEAREYAKGLIYSVVKFEPLESFAELKNKSAALVRIFEGNNQKYLSEVARSMSKVNYQFATILKSHGQKFQF